MTSILIGSKSLINSMYGHLATGTYEWTSLTEVDMVQHQPGNKTRGSG